MLKFLFSFLVVFVMWSSFSHAQVWTESNTWSPEWETKFSAWVQENWSVDFFARKTLANGQSNPYAGLRTDCADTVYSMRLIFAAENRLPFVIQDPTSSSGSISNRMSRWNNIGSETERVRKFLLYLYDLVSTRSLPNDTYPVAVNRRAVRPGSLIRTTQANHHSWTIKEIQAIGVPHLVFNSTIGASSGSMLQQRVSWPNPYWVFESNFSPSSAAGFRDWRPVGFINKSVWEVPGYSEEQYHIPLERWVKTVQGRLATSAESDEQMVRRLFETVCAGMKGRVTAVAEGIQYLRSTKNQCMDYATYDTYSTPNRDQRVFDDLVALRRAYKEILHTNGGSSLNADIKAQLNKIYPFIDSKARDEASRMPVSTINKNSTCVVEYAVGRTIDLAEAKRRMFLGHMSNNPLDEVEYRWGELSGHSQRANSCQSWDAWAPDLQQAD